MPVVDDKIIINEWETGIGESTAKGFADMRNCDPFRKPGYLELSTELVNEADPPISLVFTADASSDLLTLSSGVITRQSSQYGIYRAIKFTTTNTLPAPLAINTIYFVANNSLSATAFNVSTSLANAQAGTFIDITNTGTGVHTVTSINVGRPISIKADVSNTVYLQDANARVWYRDTNGFWLLIKGNTVTGAGADTGGSSANTGSGLAIWKNYLFAFRLTSIDVYNIATPGWTNSWQSTGSNGINHIPFPSKDGKLYFYADYVLGVKYYVGSIKQETTFDPSSSATYTYNATALDVPDSITALSDFNSDIAVGTSSNKIYPWDGSSTSFNDPITLLEAQVLALRDFNNILYISTGRKGNIYRSYGTTVEKFTDISDEFLQTLQYYVQGVKLTFNSNELLFFLIDGGQSVEGLYSVDLASKAYHLKYSLSQTNTGSQTAGEAVFVLPQNQNDDIVFVGYSYGGTTFIDTNFYFGTNISTSTRYRSYATSPLYEVGSAETPRTFQKMQIILAAPLTSGMGIRVTNRKNLSASFANSTLFDFATIGSATAFEAPVNIETAQFVQFKIELQVSASAPVNNGGGGLQSTVYSTPTIKSLIVY